MKANDFTVVAVLAVFLFAALAAATYWAGAA